MSHEPWSDNVSDNISGLTVGLDDAHGGNLLVGNRIEPPLQLDKKFLEVLSPVLTVLLLTVTTNVSPESVDSLKTPLMAAWTL